MDVLYCEPLRMRKRDLWIRPAMQLGRRSHVTHFNVDLSAQRPATQAKDGILLNAYIHVQKGICTFSPAFAARQMLSCVYILT